MHKTDAVFRPTIQINSEEKFNLGGGRRRKTESIERISSRAFPQRGSERERERDGGAAERGERGV